MRRIVLALCALTAVAGCTVKTDPPIADDVFEAATYRHDGPPSLTLYTMINNRTGNGAHASLMVNASQRVIFDPAGSFRKHNIVARGDVVYGVTPHLEDSYRRFHARETYHVIVQELEVSPEVAEMALQMVMTYGEVPDSMCTRSTSEILAQLPGLNINTTWFPKNLSEQFETLPNVTTGKFYEYDDEDRFKALAAYDPEKVRANMREFGH
ncbi:MAG: hypothetical protein JXR13_19740 [Thalassovita sp.]